MRIVAAFICLTCLDDLPCRVGAASALRDAAPGQAVAAAQAAAAAEAFATAIAATPSAMCVPTLTLNLTSNLSSLFSRDKNR